MSITKIYASKIYRASSRKDAIKAAIQNPMNLELVQQVADYLDDDSKEKLAEAVHEKDVKDVKPAEPATEDTNENPFEDDGSAPSASHSSGGSHFSPPSGGPSGNVFDDDFGTDMGEAPDIPDIPEASDDDAGSSSADAPAEPIEESTEITGVDTIDEDNEPVLQSGIIKKLLNDADDTAGVARVDIGDGEAWIYYDDKVNLNDIFDNVIALLKDSKYDMLKFSRLARTDNAVVFDIKE